MPDTTAQPAPGEAPTAGAAPPVYAHWGEVPRHLASKTQLAGADLPRTAAGPVRAYVSGYDFRGKRAQFPLYAIVDSPPTGATGPQLAAAAARRTTAARVCADCGARPQLPLAEREGRRLCSVCLRIARTVEEQVELRRRRVANAAWARELLHGAAPLAVVWTEVLDSPADGDRPSRAAVAARVQVADEHGRQLADLLIRLTGPRTAGAPNHALPTAEGSSEVTRVLEGRRTVAFGPLRQVRDRLAALHHPLPADGSEEAGFTPAGQHRPVWSDAPAERYRQWRGDLDPATGELLAAWPPGSATRAWWCLRQMADTKEGCPGDTAAQAAVDGTGPGSTDAFVG